jgi:LPS sulfotransferase NodH
MLQLGLITRDGEKVTITSPESFDYMLLGMLRSGTHWLASRLSSHPQVGNFGEMNCEKYPDWMGMREEADLYGYIAHYKDCGVSNPRKDFLDFHMTHLTHKPVIHLVRDPEACARSLEANYQVMERTPTGDYISHSKGDEEEEHVEVSAEVVAELAEYIRTLQTAFRVKLFECNRHYIEVSYEDMKADPESTDQRVLEFLGAKPWKLTSALVPTRRKVSVVEAPPTPSVAGETFSVS